MLKLKSKKFCIVSLMFIAFTTAINPHWVTNKHDFSHDNLVISEISSKISIYGNHGWLDLASSGICSGAGISSNPYILRDLIINGGGSAPCIAVQDSDCYFEIINCTLFNGYYSGLLLRGVKNGKIINNNCSNSIVHDSIGINLENSANNLIQGNIVIANSEYGINLYESSNNEIKENIINYNDFAGIFLGPNSRDNKIILNDIGHNIHGIYLYSSSDNNWIERNLIHNNEVGVQFDGQLICNTLLNNQFVDNNADQLGTQGICPFTILIITIIITSISVIGILSFIVIKRRRRVKIPGEKLLAEIKTKELPTDKPEVFEEVELLPSINLEESVISNEALVTAEKKEEIQITEQPREQKTRKELKKTEEMLDKVILPISEVKNKKVKIDEMVTSDITHEIEIESKDIERKSVEDMKHEVPSEPESEDLYPIPSDLEQKEPERVISQIEVKEKGIPESPPPLIPQIIEQTMEDRKSAKEQEMKVIEKKDVHFCTNCGKPLVNTWKICAYCGARIKKELWDIKQKPEPEIITLKKGEEPEVSFSKEIEKESFEERTLIKSKELIQEKFEPEKGLEEKLAVKEVKPIEFELVKLKPLKYVCLFCGFENILEQKRCKQCGHKLQK